MIEYIFSVPLKRVGALAGGGGNPEQLFQSF